MSSPKSRLYSAQEGGCYWFVVVSAFVICALVDGLRYTYGLLYLQLLQEFKAGNGVTAWIGSLMFGMVNVAAPVASAVVNKYGCRLAVVSGSILAFLGFSLSFFATSVYVLYVTMGLIAGVGLSLMYIPPRIALLQSFKKRRSLACGLGFSGSGIGGFAFGPLLKILLDEYNLRGALLLLAAIMFNGAVAGSFILPSPTPQKDENKQQTEELLDTTLKKDTVEMEDRNTISLGSQGNEGARDDKIHIKDFRGGIRNRLKSLNNILHFSLLKDSKFVLFLISQLFLALAYSIPFTFLPDRVVSLGYDRSRTAWMLSSLGISNTTGRILTGVLANRKSVNRTQAYAIVQLLAGISCLLFPLYQSYWSFVVFCVVLGHLIGAFVTLNAIVLPELFEEEKIASAVGLSVFCRAPGDFLGPPTGGWIVDGTGRLDIPFVVSGGAFSASFLCIGLILVSRYFSKDETVGK